MQGSYKQQGLPRPYYMKPTNSKKNSPYNKLPTHYFSSPKRKILGYIILITLFGSCMWLISKDFAPQPDARYEVVAPESNNINKIVGSTKNADKESENIDLAGNMAHGSNGQVGMGVPEAPKGGMANEAPVVGNDKEKLVDGKKKGTGAI